MNHKKRLKSVRLTLFLIATIFISTFAIAQKTSKYTGETKLNNELYFSEFEYYISKGDTVLQGAFELKKPLVESDKKNLFDFLTVIGQFHENKPEGYWKLLSGRISPVGAGFYKDYFFTNYVDGNEITAKGKFRKGKKQDRWIIFDGLIEKSNIVDTILYTELPFKDDQIIGDFIIYDKNYIIKGTVNNNEMADNIWTLYKKNQTGEEETIKKWIFDDGQLTQKTLYLRDKTLNLSSVIENDSEFIIDEIELSEDYFTIINLINSLNDKNTYNQFVEQVKAEDLFLKAIKRLKQTDEFMLPITNAKITPSIKIKLRKFPYSKEELKSLKSIKEKAIIIDSIIDIIQTDQQINTSKISKKRVAYFASVTDEIKSQLMKNIDSTIFLFENEKFIYIDRDKWIEKNMIIKSEIEIQYKNGNNQQTSKYIFNNFQQDKNEKPLKQLEVFTSEILKEVNGIRDSLDFYIFELKREQKFVDLEKKLISKYENSKKLTDSLITPDFDEFKNDLNKILKGFLETQIGEYSALETSEQKIEVIESLITCFEVYNKLLHTIENIPRNVFTIRDSYTKQVFNPYTYTNMEEIVKHNIFKAFNKILMPAMFENLVGMNCENINDYENNFEIVFKGMLELLKKETRKIERKVKRTDDPKKVAEILDLNLIFKQK